MTIRKIEDLPLFYLEFQNAIRNDFEKENFNQVYDVIHKNLSLLSLDDLQKIENISKNFNPHANNLEGRIHIVVHYKIREYIGIKKHEILMQNLSEMSCFLKIFEKLPNTSERGCLIKIFWQSQMEKVEKILELTDTK